MTLKRALIVTFLVAGFALAGAQSAWAATCNASQNNIPASNALVRGTVTVTWDLSSTTVGGPCTGAVVDVIRPASVGGGTVNLGTFNLPTLSTQWDTATAAFPSASGYTIRFTPIASSGHTSGNPKSSINIGVDNAPPTIAFVSRTAPTAAGWNSTDVTATWSCSDTSGVISSTVTQTVTTEGTSLSLTGTCTDLAGNTTSDTISGINVDKTAPSIASGERSPPPNAAGWNNSSVTVSWTCSDALSGPTSATVSTTLATEGDNQSAGGTCTDLAGNMASDTVPGIKIDLTDPTVTFDGQSPAANGAGWNNTSVGLSWSCSDALSGAAVTSTGATLSAEGTDQGATGTCTDVAGNDASDTQGGIDIDLTDPVTTFDGQSPAANDAGWNNSAVTLTWTCTDALSGATATDATAEIDAEGADQGATGTCTDVAGNDASDTQGGIDIDLTDPVPTFDGQSPAANDAGWNNSAVTLTWTCTDALSGATETGTSADLTGEGAEQGATGTCTDVAGNDASDTQGGVDIDLTDPVPTFDGQSPAANDAGWNNSAVTLTWTCTDALSGTTAADATAELTGEGAEQGATGTCTDVAGNDASDTQGGVDIDLTDPVPTFDGQSPAANDAGWNNSAVTLTWTCTDALSGATAEDATAELTAEGADQDATGTCTDVAGNDASDTQGGVDIDLTEPVVTFDGQSPAANGAGWNNGAVTLSWSCTDALSGATATGASAELSAEGADQGATGTCTDVAGNDASDTQGGIDIDLTDPVATFGGQSPAANDAGWNNTSVDLSWSCSDTLSGPVATSTSATIETEGADQGATGRCTDAAGNDVSDTQGGIDIDLTGPSLTFEGQSPAANDAGWNNSAVTLAWTCTDALSGVATADLEDILSEQGEGQTGTGTCGDVAGNDASDEQTGINIDLTPPVMRWSKSPLPNANGWNNSDVTVSYACEDDLSGIAAVCAPPKTISKNTAGSVVTATASDLAGNVASSSPVVKLDKIGPWTEIVNTTPSVVVRGLSQTMELISRDNLSGVASVAATLVSETDGQTWTLEPTCVTGCGTVLATSVVTLPAEAPPGLYRMSAVSTDWADVQGPVSSVFLMIMA